METNLLTGHQLEHLFLDEMHFCACNIPNAGARLVLSVLRLCPLSGHRPEFERLIPDAGAQHIILSLLNHVDLLEHGGGIGGSWLTDKGRRVLASLEELAKTDQDLDSLFPDEPTPDECEQCYGVSTTETK